MKKLLLSFGMLAMGTLSFGQIFDESFDTSIPGTWTIIDVDGYTSTTSQSAYASWAWNSGAQDASSTSWYNNSGLGPTDDWLITPAIVIPGTGTYQLSFDGASHEPSYLEEYEVLVSTTGTAVGNFGTNLLSVTDEPDSPTNHVLSLAAYSGQTIYIAFHHISDDESILHIDNVLVDEVFANDIEMLALTMSSPLLAGSTNITGTVRNAGANPITSFDIDWNDGTSHNQTFTQTIAPGATYNFTHGTALNAVVGTNYNINVCASIASDGDATNDCLSGNYSVAGQLGTRLPLMEVFTSSTCPPCYTLATSGFGGSGLASYLDGANANHTSGAELAVISNQVNWPGSGDHAYNADIGTRVSYYGISGAPTVLVDANAASGPSDVTAAAAVPAYMDIAATHTVSGGVVTVNVTVDPYASYNGAKLHIVLEDKSYAAGGSGDNFTNGETEFHHVARKYIPGATGTTVNLVNGTQYTTSKDYSYTFFNGFPAQGSFDLHQQSAQEVVVFVQSATGEILNAAISIGEALETDEIDSELGLSIYPNPSIDMTNVRFTIAEAATVEVEVVNTLGQVVSSELLGEVSGSQNVEVNTAGLDAGMYLVNILVDGKVTTKKLSVRK